MLSDPFDGLFDRDLRAHMNRRLKTLAISLYLSSSVEHPCLPTRAKTDDGSPTMKESA